MTNLIGTDQPFSDAQLPVLRALLDTLIPAEQDGQMPGAGDLDPAEFVNNPQSPDFDEIVARVLEWLGPEFAGMTAAQQEERVEALSRDLPGEFAGVYMQTLAVYYRQNEVLRAIGSGEGPPFPRGNEVPEGDLSLLDPVVRADHGYRRT